MTRIRSCVHPRASLPLPIFEPDRAIDDPWALPHPVPSALVALWPGANPPQMEAVAEALFAHVPQVRFVGELTPRPDDSLWTMVVDLPAPIDGRMVVFAEPAPPPGAQASDPALPMCSFVVGIELVLPRDETLSAFTAAMGMLSAMVPDAPAILDVASSTWHGRQTIEAHFADAAGEPPEWMLWSVQAVTARRDADAGSMVWLRTSGLWRCGCPELELIEVPCEAVHAGVALLQGLAGLALDDPLPPPGAVWSVGHDFDVLLQPWQAVVGQLDPSTPGSLASRRIDERAIDARMADQPLAGVRAIVCEPAASGPWRPPTTALRRIQGGEAALLRSTRSIERLQRAAQRSWSRCATALRRAQADGGGASVRALVQATFGHGESREHLWLEVLDAPDESTIVGWMLNAAAMTEGLGAGDRVRVDRDRVVDWHLRRGDRIFTPDDLAGIEETS